MDVKRLIILVTSSTLMACTSTPKSLEPTLAGLIVSAEIIEPQVQFEISRDQLVESYRRLVELSTDTNIHDDALRRFADLELEASIDKQLSDDELIQMDGNNESQQSIEAYERYLTLYPDSEQNDLILYQLSRAHSLNGRPEKSLLALNQISENFPDTQLIDEVQFRRGEIYFVARNYRKAAEAYDIVVNQHPQSQFFEKSLYKAGWSQFKLNNNRVALGRFIKLLDHYESNFQIHETGLTDGLSRGDRELIEDVLRVVSLTLSYESETMTLSQYFLKFGARVYEPLIYQQLADLYLSRDRITDAVDVFLEYGATYPYSRYTPGFHQQAIDNYHNAGFSQLVLQEKIVFVNHYDVKTEYWNRQNFKSRENLKPLLKKHLHELATYFHSVAQAVNEKTDYETAAGWYQRYLNSFPRDANSAEMNFLLAESHYDSGNYESAISEYQKSAYDYPVHPKSAEAGYAVILTYDQLIKQSASTDRGKLETTRLNSAQQFIRKFPNDTKTISIELQMAQQFFNWKRYRESIQTANRLNARPQLPEKTKFTSASILADSYFFLGEFRAAENAYVNLMAITSAESKQYTKIQDQLVTSIYRQGEISRDKGNHLNAANHFSRVGKVVPKSPQRIIADFDAATAYLALENWAIAIQHLESFRSRYPKDKKWKTAVTEKLALAYSENKNYVKAADEMMTLSKQSKASDRKKDLLWQSADLYQQGGQPGKAIDIYKSYVRTYPNPLSRSIELRNKIADSYLLTNDTKKRHYWLRQIIKTDAQGGKQRSDRTRYLAAKASLELIQPLHQQFKQVALTVPLKKSLKKKKTLMQDSIKAYSKAIKYQVLEVTTSATYSIAEIYNDFAKALLESQRPKGLNEDELEEYNLLLEDQAFPFEEKAISIHLSNFNRIPTGSWDDAVKNSLEALAKLMPFRFARAESVIGYVDVE